MTVARLALALSLLVPACALAQTRPTVRLIQKDGGFSLLRNDQPFFIRGAGGDASKKLLLDCGGNSFRTWSADRIDDKLDEAQRLGLGVTIGIWMGHENQGFNYADKARVAKQLESARAAVMKYKDHPAVLLWAVGNEMEGYAKGDNPAIWAAVNDVAGMIHKLDPSHPTVTVIAEVGGERIKSINGLCPDIDIVGINSYGGGPTVAQRYRAAGGVKPYIITEFGPPGTWEVVKNAWGVPLELTSTKKADRYRETYAKSVLAEEGKLCLGSYAFAWGNKQEATATWYGLFLPDGTRLEAMDTLTELWSGRKPANRCPQIAGLRVLGKDQAAAGETVQLALDVSDPEGDELKVTWTLTKDPGKYETGGQTQAVPPSFPEAIVRSDVHGAELRMPRQTGGYWLYAVVTDGHGGGAVADVPLRVIGPKP